MKKLLLICPMIAIALSSFAQALPIDTVNHQVNYTDVVKIDSASKVELYTRAREWTAKSFRSAKSVIQMDDKDAGKIIIKGIERGDVYMAPMIYSAFTERYTVSISIKDGKYKYEISDFTVENDPSQGVHSPELPLYDFATKPKWKNNSGEYRKVVKGYIDAAVRVGDTLTGSLKTAMSKQSTGQKIKDDF